MSNIGLKKWLALSLHTQIRKNLTKLHDLTYIFWECTLRCNLACLHCGSDCTKNNTIKDMPIIDFLKAIDEIVPHINPNKVTIGLTGGEPLMRNDLENCGYELYQRGFPWGFVTNGILLTEKRLTGLLNSGLRVVTISLDGLEQNHNWIRGLENVYKKTIHAIHLVSQTDNLVYDVVTCVNKRNLNELSEIKDLLIKMNVKNWRLFTIFPIGRARNHADLQLSDIEFVELFEFIKNTRKEGLINANYGCEGYLGIYEREVRDNFFYCRAGINVGSVLADGSISACPSLRNKYIQGNIYSDNFIEIWNNKYEIMRNRDWTKTGQCKNCKSYQFCVGNGLHLRDNETNELLFCHLERINKGLKRNI
jgi:radical SAM enzyme (rSAM/lipoprotein system)